MEKLDNIIFYTIDRSIRTYRQYAQRQLKNAGYSITIDQWLVIKTIMENPDIKQQELGEKIFKDNASVTRIIELLVKAKYLKRKSNSEDRRRFGLEVTEKGKEIIAGVYAIVLKNRATALKGISKTELEITKKVLERITGNCH
ncbi:MAG: MarR family transcriptional regulator [Bacteroidetes bacterium]|nr:MarR family transcriptional regulator [Bacteroidota bacterium]